MRCSTDRAARGAPLVRGVLLAAGVDFKMISSIIGHSSVVITFDRYSHVMLGGLNEAAAAANAYLARAAAPSPGAAQGL